ncbi:tetratricopeptide repeat protein [Candidatus Sulfurimonas marisnigri]|uniref:Tetratricopeptide repeat protein n=1 Tax=Candidatus Sulfurimonas marisnigri TaxID=2740405 RepID=A0A7S7LZF0_9BACT|nr:tetratricopeptide repeat protein [Candidatus Sulfurimonas marisnigri]QOY54262.1 tetratricopeptide repeat protein [Candidatus Sulfurimonas marisnigri]
MLKNFFFTLIIVSLFFAGLEFILALIGVKPILQTEDPLVGFSKNIPLFEETRNSDGSVILESAPNKRAIFNYQAFPMEKASNAYRIFCMGGSTTYGRPYRDKVSFTGWLRAFLKNADQKRKWEVINAGGISYASYRVARLMKEIKQYKPDLFIVYTGQNEFLEERSYGDMLDIPSWVLEFNDILSNTRTYAAVKKGIDALRQDTPEKTKKRYQLSGEVDEILSHTAGPTSYHRDEKLKSQIISHYSLNMQLMINIAKEAGAKIIFVNPAINLKDMSPFKSEHKELLSKKELKKWQELYNRASILHKVGGNIEDALVDYKLALSIDESYAELHYRVGQVLFELKKYDEAQKAFQRASDEDIAPLRILSSMQKAVEDVASENDVPLIDFSRILREAYSREYNHAVFGKEYFVDHVHTNLDGYRLLGLTLFDELIRQGIAKPDETWNEERIKAVEKELTASLDAKALADVMVNLSKVLIWAGKFDEGRNAREQAIAMNALIPKEPGMNVEIGIILMKKGKTDEALNHFKEELKISKDNRIIEKTHLYIAYVYYNDNQFDEAEKHLRIVLKNNSSLYTAHAHLGTVLEKQGRIKEAHSHYTAALRINPDYELAKKSIETMAKKEEALDKKIKRFRGIH